MPTKLSYEPEDSTRKLLEMRDFFRGLVLGMFLLQFSFPLYGQDLPSADQDLGQNKLRSEYRASRKSAATLNHFMQRRWFVDIVEEYWIARLQDTETKLIPKSFSSLSSELRKVFSEQPYNIPKLIGHSAALAKVTFQRPLESINAIESIGRHFALPLYICLFIFMLIYLYRWLPPIKIDLLNRFHSSTARVLPLTLILLILASLFLKMWIPLLFTLSLFCLFYSRIKYFFIFTSITMALLLNLSSFGGFILEDVQNNLAIEALAKGRTRLTYPEASLDKLKSWQKSSWALLNGDDVEASFWAKNSEPSLQAEMMKANVLYSPATRTETLERYLQINRQYPSNQQVLFNLSLLSTELQNLISADEYRSKINKIDFDRLSERLEKTSLPIIHPFDDKIVSASFVSAASKTFKAFYSKDSGFNLFLIFWVLFPWLLILIVWLIRNRASGLCVETGTATTHFSDPYSRLALQVLQKSEDLNPSLRQKYIKLQRHYEQEKYKRIKRLSWVFPAVYEIFNWNPVSAILKVYVVYGLFWLALSISLREQLLSLLGFNQHTQLNVSHFSTVIFITAASLHLFMGWRSRKKAYE